jgi:phage tail sheath protein FI
MPFSTYATPGVYVEEINTLPPSITDIATAIPAFIGYTEKHLAAGDVEVDEISSLRDFEERFGRVPVAKWKVRHEVINNEDVFTLLESDGTNANGGKPVERFSQPKYLLWYAINHYYRNGGGRCYVVSVGKTTEEPFKDSFIQGLEKLESYDEPTLIVLPEATKLDPADYAEVCQAALQHAAKLQDRFVILDLLAQAITSAPNSQKLVELRGLLGNNDLDRGAAYFPYLNTTLNHITSDEEIKIESLQTNSTAPSSLGAGTPSVSANPGADITLKSLQDTHTSLFNQIKKILNDQRVILPPSAAIAGVYASTDRERGVWKAPANVSLQSVVSPVIQLTDEQQAAFNVDATTGKSINAIRSFTGKGTLVWGSRTLAGNDNEWRYVPVRRLFISVEESIKKATAFAVFEANDISTWLKVKGMIDSYLYNLWSRGALQGSKPEDAYFVNVGLGKTMTSDDILNGRLVVEVGLAVVRPAEFIILRFAHKLAQ